MSLKERILFAFFDLKEKIFDAYNWRCQCSKDCYKPATDLNHLKIQSKVNKEKFPLYIHSPFNLKPWNNGCHLNKPLPKEPSDELCQVYEDYLKGLKDAKK